MTDRRITLPCRIHHVPHLSDCMFYYIREMLSAYWLLIKPAGALLARLHTSKTLHNFFSALPLYHLSHTLLLLYLRFTHFRPHPSLPPLRCCSTFAHDPSSVLVLAEGGAHVLRGHLPVFPEPPMCWGSYRVFMLPCTRSL